MRQSRYYTYITVWHSAGVTDITLPDSVLLLAGPQMSFYTDVVDFTTKNRTDFTTKNRTSIQCRMHLSTQNPISQLLCQTVANYVRSALKTQFLNYCARQ